jgi:hypothetical protein
MDSVKVLIDKYGLEDSMKSNEVGAFATPEFQKLYNDLIAKGMTSEIDALQVGMTIEDVDIYDLEKYLANTKNSDVKTIFENLDRGSYNHMKAFKRQLDRYNADYQAQYISNDKMTEVLNSQNTHGHGNQSNGNNNGCHGDTDCINERINQNNTRGRKINFDDVQEKIDTAVENKQITEEDAGIIQTILNLFKSFG